jgi:pimeloyl-ACP methyl ester carboxylesterase
MGEHVRAGDLDMWVERRGTGPDVLLIAGLGDPAEAWQFQLDGLADRYRLTAYDNRGMGRTPLPAEPFSVATMADDAAALLRALGVPAAHVAGFPAAAPSRKNSRSGTPNSSAAWSWSVPGPARTHSSAPR